MHESGLRADLPEEESRSKTLRSPFNRKAQPEMAAFVMPPSRSWARTLEDFRGDSGHTTAAAHLKEQTCRSDQER